MALPHKFVELLPTDQPMVGKGGILRRFLAHGWLEQTLYSASLPISIHCVRSLKQCFTFVPLFETPRHDIRAVSFRREMVQTAQKRHLFRSGAGRGGLCLFAIRSVVGSKQVFCAPCPESRLGYIKLFRYIPPTSSSRSQFQNVVNTKDRLGSADGKVLSRLTNRTPRAELGLVALDAGVDSFFNDIPFELGEGAEYVQQKPRSGIALISVDSLGYRNEPHAGRLQFLNAVHDVPQRTSPPIKLPDNYDIDFPAERRLHQRVETRPGVLRSADGVDILTANLPAARLAVGTEVSQLHFAVLISSRNACINSGFHAYSILDGKHNIKVKLTYVKRKAGTQGSRRIDGKTGRKSQGEIAHARTAERDSPDRGAKALGRQTSRATARITVRAAARKQVAA
jgi:hypothetical protein